jgi:5-methyltetrahydropteroyltriglutamate--homocysteine methyltransferase
MDSHILTHSLGYPRIGEKRELKKAIEAFWQGEIPVEELQRAGKQLRETHWLVQREAGLDLIPSNDFSYYDQMLDMTCLLGNVPRRFGWNGDPIGLGLVFQIARGTGSACNHEVRSCGAEGSSIHASEMTKWFDTNYHYIVPEFRAGTTFKLGAAKPFDEFQEALALGIRTKPVLIRPFDLPPSRKERGCRVRPARFARAFAPRLLGDASPPGRHGSRMGATRRADSGARP